MIMRLLTTVFALLVLPNCVAQDGDTGSSDDRSDTLGDYGRVLVKTTNTKTICHASEVSDACTETLAGDTFTVTATVEDDGRGGLTIETQAVILLRPEGGGIQITPYSANLLDAIDNSSAAMDVVLMRPDGDLELREHFPRNAFLAHVIFDATRGVIRRFASGPEACQGIDTVLICDQDNQILDIADEGFARGGYAVKITPLPYFNIGNFDEGTYEISVVLMPLASSSSE